MMRYKYVIFDTKSTFIICSGSYKYHGPSADVNRYFYHYPEDKGVPIGFRFLLREKK